MNYFLFVLGVTTLIVGSDLLVRGASKLALSFGISPLVVGLTIVAFGTSSSEIAVSIGAILNGTTDIAVGNVVCSNIFNILFILGLSALITPLVVNIQIIRQEIPIMIGATLLLVLMAAGGHIVLWEGAILFSLLLAYTVFLIVQSRKETSMAQAVFADKLKSSAVTVHNRHLVVQILFIVTGLALLIIGSHWLVTAAVAFAKALGVSDLIIGLTIVAAGTSMPEVATSIMAAIKGERDIAVGNIIGSNIFNILGCVGLSTLVSGGAGLAVNAALMHFDMWVMLAVALACIPIFLTGREIARWEGGVFLFYYIAYTTYLVLDSQAHDALKPFSMVMISFVLPITVITLLLVLIRQKYYSRD